MCSVKIVCFTRMIARVVGSTFISIQMLKEGFLNIPLGYSFLPNDNCLKMNNNFKTTHVNLGFIKLLGLQLKELYKMVLVFFIPRTALNYFLKTDFPTRVIIIIMKNGFLIFYSNL